MSLFRGLREFLRDSTALLRGARNAEGAVAGWTRALAKLRRVSASMADAFGRLRVKRIEGSLRLGRVELHEFSRLLRLGEGVRAWERATGEALPRALRETFGELDRVARTVMPDARVLQHVESTSRARNGLIARGSLRANERIVESADLLRLMRSDRALEANVQKLMARASRTRKILYFGGAIVVTGVSAAIIANEAALHAQRNSGCFLYTTNQGGSAIRKCRVVGCSCPVALPDQKLAVCAEDDLWERMRVARTACGEAADRKPPYCVHCDMNEKDPDALDFVDTAALSSDAYVQCEHQDALDALHDFIGSTIDDITDPIANIGKGASASLRTSSRYLPWIVFAAIGVVLVGVLVAVYRAFNRTFPVQPPPAPSYT